MNFDIHPTIRVNGIQFSYLIECTAYYINYLWAFKI